MAYVVNLVPLVKARLEVVLTCALKISQFSKNFDDANGDVDDQNND